MNLLTVFFQNNSWYKIMIESWQSINQKIYKVDNFNQECNGTENDIEIALSMISFNY